jgi:hypothetical protein
MAQNQIEHKAVYGLQLQSNSFKVQEGSLEVAENITVVQDNIYKLRRGFKEFVDPSPAMVTAQTEYQDKIVAVAEDRVVIFNQVETGTDIGDYSSTTTMTNDTGVTVSTGTDGQKPRFVESNGNLYFTSDDGVMKLESVTGTVLKSGIDRALDLNIFRLFKPTGGPETYFPTNSQIGYRIVWLRKDANQNTIIGSPSEFAVLANSGTSSAYAVGGYSSSAKTFTSADVNTGTEEITIASHGMATGQAIKFTTVGTLATPLVVGTTYYVINVSTNIIKVAATLADATAGTAINITAAGAGTSTVLLFGPSYTVTLTAGSGHGFSSLEFISVSSATGNIPDGTYQITSTTSTTVTFDLTISPAPLDGTLTWGTFKYGKIQSTLPDQIQTTSYIYQIYRAEASALSTISPDESTLQLVDELNVTSDDLSVGFITYYDTTPDLLKAQYLYTNPNTGEPRGEAEANEKPPQCKDMALFKNHVFYANCQQPYNLPISLLASTSTTMPDNSQFTISQDSSGKSFVPADVDTGTERIAIPSHGLTTGDPIRFVTTGTLPGGLTETGIFYAISVSSGVLKVASSYANAIALTPINLTTTGTGTFYVYKVRPFIGHAGASSPNDRVGNRCVQADTIGVAGTTVTLTKTAGHGFSTGDQIAVVEAVDSSENQLTNFPRGLYTITRISASQFSFTVSPAPTTPASITFQGTKDASQNRIFYISQSSVALSTVASAIDTTARAIVKAINQDPSQYCIALYFSGTNDIPGKMAFRSISSTSTFTVSAVTAAIAETFLPIISQTDSTATGTRNDEQGVLYVGEPNEPEGVPLANSIIVGSRSDPILRIKALRDSLIVLKREGVFRINGFDINSFQPTILDSTVSCRASDSVAVLNNQVFCLSTQGVVAISENAAAIMSRPIEPVITAILGKRSSTDGSDLVESMTHAGSYESERLYLLSTMSPQATTNDVTYVFNQLTNAWTTWDRTYSDFFINSAEDKAYYVDNDGLVFQERKKNNRLDYTEEEFDTTILTAPSVTTVTMSVVGGTAAIGDIFVKTGTQIINRIIDISTSGGITTYTFANSHALTALDTGLLYKAIEANMRTSPMHGGEVSRMKQFSEFQATFRNQASMSRMTVSFVTDAVFGTIDTDWQSTATNLGWGYEPWGNFPWGLEDGINVQFETTPVQILRTYIPLEAQRATYIQVNMRHAVAAENLMMQALAYTARAYGQRTTR